jgi:hypothetical protein
VSIVENWKLGLLKGSVSALWAGSFAYSCRAACAGSICPHGRPWPNRSEGSACVALHGDGGCRARVWRGE